MKTVPLLFVSLILSFNPAFAAVEDIYNGAQKQPSYNCGNGFCYPSGIVQGNHLVSKYNDDYVCQYGYCVPKNLNQLYPNAVQSQLYSQTNSPQNMNNEPLRAEIKLMSASVTNSPVYVGCWARGGLQPYQITMKMPPPLWGSDTKTFNGNFGEISETFLIPHNGEIFSCTVQDAIGRQSSNSLSVPVSDGSTNIVSGQSGISQSLQSSQISGYQTSTQSYESQSGQSSGQSSNSLSNNQDSGQYLIQQKAIQDDLNKTLEVLGLFIVVIVGLIFVFYYRSRHRTIVRAEYRPSFSAVQTSYTATNTDNTTVERQGNTIVETRTEIAEWNPEFWQRIKTEFPHDWERLKEWIAKNADDVASIYHHAQNYKEAKREILERARKELKLKLVYCEFCKEICPSEDALYKHIKRHHGKRSPIGGD